MTFVFGHGGKAHALPFDKNMKFQKKIHKVRHVGQPYISLTKKIGK